MEALGSQGMGFDQKVEGFERDGAGADLIGERRETEIHTFQGVTITLPVQRLMLAKLFEHQHGQEAWSEQAARRDMEGSWGLRDFLARPAREFLPNGFNDFKLTGDRLHGSRNCLAKLGEPVGTT